MRTIRRVAAIVVAAAALAGCQTSEDAAASLRSVWIGQPVDNFFMQNGPPVSRYVLDNGGAVYTWRGGRTSYTKPAQVTSSPSTSVYETSRSKTRTTTRDLGPGRSEQRSRTTGTSFSIAVPTGPTLFQPAQTVQIFCEAQLTTDASGTIVAVRISRDTEGAGLSLSRCAELFASS